MKIQSQESAFTPPELSGCHFFHSTYKNHFCIKKFTHIPSGHYFNTSKQSNYQCHYLHSIVMELMLWQIVENAGFHGHSYSKSCVSSDCLWSPSTAHSSSVFLLFASKVTLLLLFQPISCCSSHILHSYWNSYLIVSCALQHRIACLKAPAFCCFCWSTTSHGSYYTSRESWIWAVGNIMWWKKTWKSWNECCAPNPLNKNTYCNVVMPFTWAKHNCFSKTHTHIITSNYM